MPRGGSKPRRVFPRWSSHALIGDECWEWTGAKTSKGYGETSCGIRLAAHRVSYALFRGPLMREFKGAPLCVLHTCDHPWCVKPSHLFLGTHGDNARDREAKGRGRCAIGQNNHSTKLSLDQVRETRAMISQGRTQTSIAREFGVSHVTISDIVTRRTWRWVD